MHRYIVQCIQSHFIEIHRATDCVNNVWSNGGRELRNPSIPMHATDQRKHFMWLRPYARCCSVDVALKHAPSDRIVGLVKRRILVDEFVIIHNCPKSMYQAPTIIDLNRNLLIHIICKCKRHEG